MIFMKLYRMKREFLKHFIILFLLSISTKVQMDSSIQKYFIWREYCSMLLQKIFNWSLTRYHNRPWIKNATYGTDDMVYICTYSRGKCGGKFWLYSWSELWGKECEENCNTFSIWAVEQLFGYPKKLKNVFFVIYLLFTKVYNTLS